MKWIFFIHIWKNCTFYELSGYSKKQSIILSRIIHEHNWFINPQLILYLFRVYGCQRMVAFEWILAFLGMLINVPKALEGDLYVNANL